MRPKIPRPRVTAGVAVWSNVISAEQRSNIAVLIGNDQIRFLWLGRKTVYSELNWTYFIVYTNTCTNGLGTSSENLTILSRTVYNQIIIKAGNRENILFLKVEIGLK